jgi:predicted ATP-grasp superfamily ATP-dependent carboligase
VKIFAFEFFSGGGLAGRPLPPGIAHEGDMMLGALLKDLAGLPDVEVVAGRDPRLPPVAGCQTLVPLSGEDTFALYARGLELADAAWPTAPETGGMLERLCRETEAAGKTLLGSRPDAVRLAASKHSTAAALREAGIAVVPTFCHADGVPCFSGSWVTKPDDGAGCVDSMLLPDWTAARARLAEAPDRLVAQPWIAGEALSLSILCDQGTGRLLSCNRQQVAIEDTRLTLQGVVVNAFPDIDGRFADLAINIAAAIPGLWGYVGVDLVLTPHGPVVLEINPRLTTSYCGLRQALGINIAAMVLAQLQSGRERRPALVTPRAGAAIEIVLEASHAA